MLKNTLILLIALLLSQNSLSAQSYFEKNILRFEDGKGWEASTPNLTNSAIKITGIMALSDGTVVDASASKNMNHYTNTMVGMIMPFAAPSTENIPSGWLICDGSEVKKDTYKLLYSVIGDSWGTPIDSLNFKLPDLRSRFLRGTDEGSNRDTSTRYKDSNHSTIDSNRAGTYQPADVAGHSHAPDTVNPSLTVQNETYETDGSTTATHTHQFQGKFNRLANDGEAANGGDPYRGDHAEPNFSTSGVINQQAHTHSVNLSIHESEMAGESGENSGLPKRMIMLYLIKSSPY